VVTTKKNTIIRKQEPREETKNQRERRNSLSVTDSSSSAGRSLDEFKALLDTVEIGLLDPYEVSVMTDIGLRLKRRRLPTEAQEDQLVK